MGCENVPIVRRGTRPWTYAEASRAVPYVRRLLATLRETCVACRLSHRKAFRTAGPKGVRPEWLRHRDEVAAVLEELDRLGVVAYQSPLRGIALFRFEIDVEADDGAAEGRVAFFIYKDSRDRIDSFAFAGDIYDVRGLFGAERPVPDALREGRTILRREEVPPVLGPEQGNCP
jgi:hypothetical protein